MKFSSISVPAVLLLALGACTPETANAQAFGVAPNPCCNVCGQRVCTCATTRPVIETHYRQQNCLTYQDRRRIVCKTEPVCVTVPVQKIDCVTVDEGCYQMVWVPKPVAKAVPRTEYHQAMSCRQVPVEICEKVPVMTSHLVPEQTIRYVTEHRTVTVTPPVPVCAPACPPVGCAPACAPACGPSCGPGGCAPGMLGAPGFAPGYPGVRPGFAPSPVAIPYSAMRDQPAPGSVAVTGATGPVTAGLVPDARYADPSSAVQNWTNVPARLPGSATPTQLYAESPAAPGTFRAPSAAAVWQMRRPGQ